ncbi:MAG: SDR family oxidoreductase [Phycisphaeraceae bacterium]|nr:SDR family oxidoreductase [Phycisphaeraceae bacterium]MCW5754716.1 SDR family oxidoreductase [Phycisphaeraceae bacterium]
MTLEGRSFPELSGRTALVTGGAGFIGSHLAHALAARGCRVRVLDDLSGGYIENLPPGVTFFQASILDDGTLKRAVAGCDWVFHQAAMVSVPESVEKPEECIRINVLGTERVLTHARDAGVRRVMFAASAAAYGNSPKLPSTEADLPDSWSPYAMSKVAGELLLQTYVRCYGLSTVSLRYFNIFGPRQDPNSPYAAVISTFARKLLAGAMPTIMGDGQQTRDFTYIDNVVLANLLAATCPRPLAGEVLNIGTGRRSSLLDVLAGMGKALGVEVSPSFGPPRAGDVRHSCADIARAREVLGYEPIVGLDEGLGRLLAWAKSAWTPSARAAG